MTDAERAELKRLTEAAARHHSVSGEAWLHRIVRRNTNAYDERFIAAANPAAVLDLLAENERLRECEAALRRLDGFLAFNEPLGDTESMLYAPRSKELAAAMDAAHKALDPEGHARTHAMKETT